VGKREVGGCFLTCPLSHLPTCERWWEVLVTLQFASDFVLRHLIYRQAIGSLPENGSGGGSCAHGG